MISSSYSQNTTHQNSMYHPLNSMYHPPELVARYSNTVCDLIWFSAAWSHIHHSRVRLRSIDHGDYALEATSPAGSVDTWIV